MKKQYYIQNGKLICNGEPVFALGQSYYPSFHTAKYPVPPEGDRIGEMKKDLEQMAQMGFNHIRFAAIGDTRLDEKGEVLVNTPFVDAMIEEAKKNGISTSVRLQGYLRTNPFTDCFKLLLHTRYPKADSQSLQSCCCCCPALRCVIVNIGLS